MSQKSGVNRSQKFSTRKIVVSGMLGGITIVLGATGLGFIPVPNLAGKATIMHVPVILAAILEGPIVGAFTGFIFGLYSFLTPAGVVPADPLVRILPRILIGITSYYTYALFRKRAKLGAIMAAIVGTLTNTVGYLGLAVLMGYFPWPLAAGIMATQMPFEMILAAVIVVVLVQALNKQRKR